MISWRSDDLIHWTDETVIDLRPFPQTKSADRVWAPQATFDPEKGEYLIYWSHHNAQGGDPNTVIWYAYSRDLKTLSTPPAELFRPANGRMGLMAISWRKTEFFIYIIRMKRKNASGMRWRIV